MINREWQEIEVRSYSGQDNYGQPTISDTSRTIKAVIKQFQQLNVENPLYADVILIALTKDEISPDDVLIIDNKQYGIKYTIPTRTYTEAFLYEQSC